jgi:hypothetical protein
MERRPGGGDGRIDVLGAPVRDTCPRLARVRVHRLEDPAGHRIDGLAVEEQTKLLHDALLPGMVQ